MRDCLLILFLDSLFLHFSFSLVAKLVLLLMVMLMSMMDGKKGRKGKGTNGSMGDHLFRQQIREKRLRFEYQRRQLYKEEEILSIHTHTQPMALQLAFSDRYSVIAVAAAIVHCQIKHYITSVC